MLPSARSRRMATITREESAWAYRHPTGALLDWSFVVASTWLLAGLHLDGWAHAHRPGLESFFTIWHGVLYSGFGLLALLTVSTWLANGRTMPAGYQPTLVGVVIFLAGGVGDMLWHELIGIEVNVEALLSPTHLMLAVGMALMVAGPMRSATRATIPALISAGLLLATLTFFTQFIQPGGRPWPLVGNRPADPVFRVDSVTPDFPVFAGGLPATELAAITGIGGILIATALVVGLGLHLLRKWELPFGSFTIVLGVASALLGLMRDTPWWIAACIGGGLAMDVLVRALRPREGGWRLRAFAAGAPAALWSAYFLALAIVGGIWWSVHLWAGAIAMSALAGLALSFIAGDRPREP